MPPAAVPSPPASMASSLLRDLGWILLHFPCAPSQPSDVGMSFEGGGGGKVGEQEGHPCLLAPGATVEAWAPLLPSLYQPVHLSPVEISTGFAGARVGLILPQHPGAPR